MHNVSNNHLKPSYYPFKTSNNADIGNVMTSNNINMKSETLTNVHYGPNEEKLQPMDTFNEKENSKLEHMSKIN